MLGQVTASSLTGQFGRTVERIARDMVERDLIQIHRIIARHRRNCSHCKPRAASVQFGQLPCTKPLAPFEFAS